MQISSQQTLPASQANAWAALNNIEVLKACIPGCESLTETEPGRYEVLITASVGPVKAKFKGKLGLADINPPESYTINFEGQGGAAGHGGGASQRREGLGGAVAEAERVAEVAARAEQLDVGVALQGRLGRTVGRAVVGHHHQQAAFRRVGQRLQETVQMRAG